MSELTNVINVLLDSDFMKAFLVVSTISTAAIPIINFFEKRKMDVLREREVEALELQAMSIGHLALKKHSAQKELIFGGEY